MSSRREFLSLLAGLSLSACLGERQGPTRTVRVGLLTSKSGVMAGDESGVLDALRFAVDEINRDADHSGWSLEAIEGDGASEPTTFAAEAARLIDGGASALFGCWTSSSRKAVLPVLDEKQSFLVYPLQYEGLEQHPRVLYTGSTPNQQILPAIRWAAEHLGDRFFLVGSDYVFPRVANALIHDQLSAMNLRAAGERYMPLSTNDDEFARLAEDIASEIRASGARVVLNTTNGRPGNSALFRAMRAAGLQPDRCPTISFSIGDRTFESLYREHVAVAGDYAMWGYLDAVNDAENTKVKKDFASWLQGRGAGDEALLSDPMVAARAGLHLWWRAVRAAREGALADVEILRESLRNRSVPSPGGLLHVDAENQHTWRHARLGRVNAKARLAPVWSSPLPIHPQPFPAFRTRAAWEELVRRYDPSAG